MVLSRGQANRREMHRSGSRAQHPHPDSSAGGNSGSAMAVMMDDGRSQAAVGAAVGYQVSSRTGEVLTV